MTLKELQKLIKEEFDSLTQEAEEDDLDVNVDSDEVEAEKNREETLKTVYDMLNTYFEGEEEGMDDMDMGDEEEMGDVEGGEEEEADLEELSNHGVGKSAKNSSGPNAGFTPAKSTKGDSKLHEGKSALQERFQKLANIIK